MAKHEVRLVVIGGVGAQFLVRKADGIGEYDDWLRNSIEKDLDGLVIVVADPKDILASKEAAGRDKDVAVLGQMRKDLEPPADD